MLQPSFRLRETPSDACHQAVPIEDRSRAELDNHAALSNPEGTALVRRGNAPTGTRPNPRGQSRRASPRLPSLHTLNVKARAT